MTWSILAMAGLRKEFLRGSIASIQESSVIVTESPTKREYRSFFNRPRTLHSCTSPFRVCT